jgi:ketosteroid isomerase-like protein
MIGKFVVRAVVLCVFLAGAPLVSAHEPAPRSSSTGALEATARGAAATVDAFHAALRRGNTAAAAALLADNALIFEAGGVERSKAEYAAHHLAADAAFTQAVASVVIRRAGDAAGNVAWIASEGRTTGTYKGQAVDRITAETMVLRRIGRSWKIVHIHWSSGASQ